MLAFESFSYPFFDLNYSADHDSLVSAFLNKPDDQGGRGLKALYVHIPFCDTICSFCPFAKSVGTPERISTYMDALQTELRVLGATPRLQEWALDSIYVGGGTPSVLNEKQITALFTVIRDSFTIKPDAEISFEYEVKSVSQQKLTTLAGLGVTRVSFGVQSFDPAVRDMVHITATLDQVYQAIGWSTALFGNTNMDMMVGFPGQDPDHALHDAHLAATSGIGSVSIYPVDYVMTLPGWQDRIRTGDLPRPALLNDRSRMFHDARAELIRHPNMTEQNMYCFGSPDAPPTRYMFSTLYGSYYDEAVGAGSGAYSFIKGLAYFNEGDERAYVKRVKAGGLPIVRSSPGHAYEKGLVFFPKRLTFDMRDLDILSLEGVYDQRIAAIVNDGLAQVDGDILRLTEPGKLVYSELMAHFFSDLQRRLYQRITRRLSEQVGVIDAQEWAAGDDRVRHMGAFSALPGASSRKLVLTPR